MTGNDPWAALDAQVFPPYTGFGHSWVLRVHLPDGPEIWNDPTAGLFTADESNLPDLLERTELLLSLFGWKGTLTLIDGRADPSDAAVLGYMDFDAPEPVTYLTRHVLENVFAQHPDAFTSKFSVVPRAVDAYRANRDEGPPGLDTKDKEAIEELRSEGAPGFAKKNLDDEGNCVCCGDKPVLESKDPRYGYEKPDRKRTKTLEEITQANDILRLSYAQRADVIGEMAEWIEDKVNIGGHLASYLVYSINELTMDSGTTYGDITDIYVEPNGDAVHIEIGDNDGHMPMFVTVREWDRFRKDQSKLRADV